jgi:uncharacterized protein YceK
MIIKQLTIVWVVMLLLSGCTSAQNKPKKDDPGSVRVSGDLTVSSVNRKGF